SHELRTPITAIKGSTDILRRGILGELNSTQKDLLETCNKAIERLLNQVNELLDFAKLENGRFELSYGEENIEHIIQEAVNIMEPLITKKRQKLKLELTTQVTMTLDRQRILQVLLNLISNSIKFTPDTGEITIKSYFEAKNVIVEIHDTGMGIPADKQKNIFTKFYQVNNQLNGTGLGLAISKQLVELHGGQIWFDTIEDKGSVFRFMLPTGNGGL
ncbi:MAG TPA: HAMP domain-containing sensor histidine kinase, partial [Bacilli bacterium]